MKTPILALAAALLLSAADAQSQSPVLRSRLDAPTFQSVTALLDSARAEGLPTQPLESKALEGVSKGADGTRIVAALRRLAGDLRIAREHLGAGSTVAELDAGASAIHSGVNPRELARLRAARPRQPLTVPLGMLADLIARGVPADTASSAALALAQSSMRDEDFVAFRRNVERDIALGAPPATATAVRMNATSRAFMAESDPLPGTTVPRGRKP